MNWRALTPTEGSPGLSWTNFDTAGDIDVA